MSRYIDADVLKKAFVKPMNDFVEGVSRSLDIGKIIDAQPTADVAEVMHGEWLSDDDGNIRCSVCGRNGVGELFCEHCGAKMDGKV